MLLSLLLSQCQDLLMNMFKEHIIARILTWIYSESLDKKPIHILTNVAKYVMEFYLSTNSASVAGYAWVGRSGAGQWTSQWAIQEGNEGGNDRLQPPNYEVLRVAQRKSS